MGMETTELLCYEHSMFGNPWYLYLYFPPFWELFKGLEVYHDTWAIPYENRKALFWREIVQMSRKIATLLIFEVLPDDCIEERMQAVEEISQGT